MNPCSSPRALDAERVRSDVDQDRPDVDAGDQTSLNGRPHGDGQVGLDLAMDRAAEPFFEQSMHQRRASCSAHQDDLVDLVGLHLGVGEGLVEAGQRLQEQRPDQLFVIVSRRSPSRGSAICPSFSAMNSSSIVVTASNDSRFLASSAARRTRALAPGDCPEVDTVLFGERVADMVEEQLVEVVAAELGVAVAGLDLDHAVLDLGHRDVERAAAQVVDQQPLHLGRVGVVGQHGGGRLVDDPDDLQAGQLARLRGWPAAGRR